MCFAEMSNRLSKEIGMPFVNEHVKRCTTLSYFNKMYIKAMVKYHFIYSRMPKIKGLIILNINKEEEQHELSCMESFRNVNWHSHFEHSLVLPNKAECLS